MVTLPADPGGHDDPARYLDPGEYVDSDDPDVVARAREIVGDAATDRERAVRLFHAVRDGIRYDPYTAVDDVSSFRASAVLQTPASFCVPKAVLLAALARAVGIPARLGFADVRNHLQSERLRERMGTDLFVFHGYTELYLGGRWVKATPAFNRELCDRFGVKPLEFDGVHDALLQEHTAGGDRHMEYLADRGTYADLPVDEIMAAFLEHYGPVAVAGGRRTGERDELFDGDPPG